MVWGSQTVIWHIDSGIINNTDEAGNKGRKRGDA
jgi:hypothetical protein